ncbi:mechanosensitive ion channel family protein [Garciella nitratireducens]|uniref:Small conductance mechanosensitive channel n=1 Tax=Garciella nitratireducens DSM 15102 TaxID=1121911 RepID=A0A1T4PEH2_9FIRM|nr:mechanosensitive ion channel family protein [Garciella nitratireducens]RBP44055.1 small conductance mechanosensitive channel [Garciella nitratireducens]SJZ89879.1 small conductance mechanosensitive channel [Garciella nitratireducens DSM 15102]
MEKLNRVLGRLNIDPSEFLGEIFQKILLMIIVFILVRIAIKLGNRFINGFFQKKTTDKFSIEERRAHTLSTILKSVYSYVIYFIGIITVIGSFVDITSLLAVAGVGSLAVAFGAQSLVEDFVTGFFIFLDDQFSVGDYVTLKNFNGIVENMGLRTTEIRDFSGDLHIIPNREIITVTNHSRGNMQAKVDVGIAYEEDIQRAIEVLENLCKQMAKENDKIVEGPYVLGVQELGDSSVNIRITAQTKNMEQWGVERQLRQKIKETFDQEGIEIPYPKRVVYQENVEPDRR